ILEPGYRMVDAAHDEVAAEPIVQAPFEHEEPGGEITGGSRHVPLGDHRIGRRDGAQPWDLTGYPAELELGAWNEAALIELEAPAVDVALRVGVRGRVGADERACRSHEPPVAEPVRRCSRHHGRSVSRSWRCRYQSEILGHAFPISIDARSGAAIGG